MYHTRDGCPRLNETAIDPNRRILTLDLIRGVAVMGILSVNIVDFSTMRAAYLNPAAFGWPDVPSLIVWALNMLFVDGKFRTLFSVLFGASMLLVIQRAEASGRNGGAVHFRRMAALFLIGAAHAILVWRGDILTLYAATGLVAYLFRNMSVEKLVSIGLTLTLFNIVLFGAIGITLYYQHVETLSPGASADVIRNWNLNLGSFYPSQEAIAADLATYLGPWTGVVAYEAGNASQIVTNILILMPDTLALMLFGMAGFKSGFLRGDWDDAAYRRIALWGICIGLIGFGGLVAVDLIDRFYVPTLLAGFESAMSPFRLAMAAGYAALLVLLARSAGPLVQRLAAVGRAAFTNYLGTSLICTFIFYGWGLGFYGSWTRAQAWLLVPAIWLLMLLWSKPWLERFRYGPLEWLWRSLSQLQLQPRRKPLPKTAAADA